MATKKSGTIDVSAVLKEHGVSLKEERVRALQKALPRLLAAGSWVMTCRDNGRLVVVGSSMKRDELDRRYGKVARVVWNDHLVGTTQPTTQKSERKSRKSRQSTSDVSKPVDEPTPEPFSEPPAGEDGSDSEASV